MIQYLAQTHPDLLLAVLEAAIIHGLDYSQPNLSRMANVSLIIGEALISDLGEDEAKRVVREMARKYEPSDGEVTPGVEIQYTESYTGACK